MAIVNLSSIIAKVRRLSASGDSFQLPDEADPSDPNSVGIVDYINSFYLYDLPAQFRSLKLKDTLTFNTIRGVDVYPFDTSAYSTVEMPCYCAKREIKLFTDAWSFYGVNYNWQQFTNFDTGDGTTGPYTQAAGQTPIIRSVNNIPYYSQNILNILVDTPAVGSTTINFASNNFAAGQTVILSGISGTVSTVLNNFSFIVTSSTTNNVVLTVTSTGLTYIGGGVMNSTSTTYNYPASRVQNVLITANVSNGSTLNVTDDGNGNLIGDCTAGTIDYDTAQISGLVFSQVVPSGETIQIQYNPVSLNIPLSILFYQNQFTLRPVPDKGYTVSLTAYRLPTQALTRQGAGSGTPELNEWWELIACGAAKKIYEDRLDSDGVALMDKMLNERYNLAYTRTYAQIGKARIPTIYADQLSNNYGSGGWGFNSGSQ